VGSDDPGQTPIEYASLGLNVPQPRHRLKLILYVVLGNVWLLVTLALYVGQTYDERSSPPMYSVYGVGRRFTGSEYELIVLAPAVLGIAFFCLGIRQGWHRKRAKG
jgi:hypothetical protein